MGNTLWCPSLPPTVGVAAHRQQVETLLYMVLKKLHECVKTSEYKRVQMFLDPNSTFADEYFVVYCMLEIELVWSTLFLCMVPCYTVSNPVTRCSPLRGCDSQADRRLMIKAVLIFVSTSADMHFLYFGLF